MKVTAKMIAEELDISTATVDRVLNNRKGVSQKTIRKVKLKAEEMGYKPNKAAKFLSTQKTMTVLFILQVIPDYFWGEIEREIRKTALLFEDFGFKVEVARVSSTEQKIQIAYFENVIEENEYDAIVITPYDSKPFIASINKAINRGIPVFSLNNDVPESQRISFVGSDYYDAGYLAAELISMFSKELKKVVIVREDEEMFQMIRKERGFRAYFQDHHLDVEIITLPVVSSYTNPLLFTNTQVFVGADGVYIANGILGEAGTFFKECSMPRPPFIVGHDISETIHEHLQQNVIQATICQDPSSQAATAVKKVFDYLHSGDKGAEKDTIVKLEIVTKTNAKYYLHR
ncbi:LacI family DNA-binding transcriptional regulator [Domibacillus tundrae]|uniref:LacI family DNA-binding transcriptional regulator n=1 Tax=Domibacillus tundrae TaxID=1587527 RepID=UPI0006180F0D|nr:LacI family DNA-binding transcriptional regulator [Domibacillus tundrae]